MSTKEQTLTMIEMLNEEQLKAVLGQVNRIYTDDKTLYLKYKKENVYFKTDRTLYDLPDFENENLLVTELGNVHKYPKYNNCLGDYTLNIVNSYSMHFLETKGLDKITLSPELNYNQIKDILKINNNAELIVYGTLELMVMNHCLIKANDKCSECHKQYYLKNKQGKLFPIVSKNCKTHIMHHEKINLLDCLKDLKTFGLNNIRLEFFNESALEITDILKAIKKDID